jgi:hypothetical protein
MRTGSIYRAVFKGQHRAEFAWFSILSSLPGLSINAERAARQILEAIVRKDSELIIGAPAKVAAWLVPLMPGIFSRAMRQLARILPEPGSHSSGLKRLTGEESRTSLSDSPLTYLSQQAAKANIEHIGHRAV